MKIKAPFHVAADWNFNWLLFAYKAEFSQLDRVQWDYWQVQRLATQIDRLRLMHEAEKARKHKKRSRETP